MADTKVITGEVRFSYVTVFEPKAVEEGGQKKYSVSILIPKTDTATINKVKTAINTALEDKKSLFGGKVPKTFKNPLHDGDLERDDDENYQGCMFINAYSSSRPGIIGLDRQPIMDSDEFYSGCYGHAAINFYAYAKGSKGVAAGLNNLMKTRDGVNLGGGKPNAVDDFGSISTGLNADDDLM